MRKPKPNKPSTIEIPDDGYFTSARVLLVILALISCSYMFSCLERTLVAPAWLVTGGIMTGVLILLAIRKKQPLYRFMILGVCSLMVNIPLIVNNVFASDKDETLKQPIIQKHYRQGKSEPSVVINYQGLVKSIPVYDESQLDSSSYLILSVNKGLLGYYVIKQSKLAKE